MKVHLNHNIEIKTFDDIVCHLELKKDKMKSSKPAPEVNVASVGA